MAERSAKVRRILGASGIPHARLARLLKSLAEEGAIGVEDAASRQQLQRTWQPLVKSTGVVEELQLEDGSLFEWECVSFGRAPQHIAQESDVFRHLLAECWSLHPCSDAHKWSLLVYGDEVTPGNPLRPDNKRKMCCFYIAIRELGGSILKHEMVWIPVGVIRTEVTKRVRGGLSTVFKVILRRLFLHEALGSEGITLDLQVPSGSYARLLFCLGNVVADADAHRGFWSWKGASAKLACACCKNIVNDTEASSIPGLQSLRCADPSLFGLVSNEDWWHKAQTLETAAEKCSKAHMAKLQTAVGLVYSSDGVLWDRALRPWVRPADVFTYDSMHVFLSNGIAQEEVDAMLSAVHEAGLSMDDMRAFVCGPWQTCKAFASKGAMKNIFTATRLRAFLKDGALRIGASEMLALLPVLYMFVILVLEQGGHLPDESRSFKALVTAVRCIQLAKLGRAHVQDTLAAALRCHLEAFMLAYPDRNVRPKHHFAQHIPLQVQRDGTVWDAFVGERKHQALKAIANEVRNTRTFERSVVFPALARQVQELRDTKMLQTGLKIAESAPEIASAVGIPSALAAASAVWRGTLVAQGDLVELGGRIVFVRALVELDAKVYCLAELLSKVAQKADFCWLLRSENQEECFLLPLDDSLRLLGPWSKRDNLDIVAFV